MSYRRLHVCPLPVMRHRVCKKRRVSVLAQAEALKLLARLEDLTARLISWKEQMYIIGIGIPYDMLLDALSEALGAIDINCSDPIGNAIRQRPRKLLDAKCASS
jgi:hypothetical protein